jgi:hypothetical protein
MKASRTITACQLRNADVASRRGHAERLNERMRSMMLRAQPSRCPYQAVQVPSYACAEHQAIENPLASDAFRIEAGPA